MLSRVNSHIKTKQASAVVRKYGGNIFYFFACKGAGWGQKSVGNKRKKAGEAWKSKVHLGERNST